MCSYRANTWQALLRRALRAARTFRFTLTFVSVSRPFFLHLMALSKPTCKVAEKDQLTDLLKKASIADEVIKHIEVELGYESVADFAKCVREAHADDELEALIKAMPTQPARAQQQISRIRQAWTTAMSAFGKAKEGATAVLDADLDAPLSDQTATDLKAAWEKSYAGLEWSIRLTPADALVARLWRQLQRKLITAMAVEKVKALVHSSMPSNKFEFAMGDARMEVGADKSLVIRNVTQYYFGLRILGHGMAYAGNWDHPSKLYPGTMVKMCPLGVNMEYADEALRYAMLWDGSPHVVLQMLRERDIATRSHMVQLMRRDYPQGEALREAMKELKQDWKSAHVSHKIKEEDDLAPDHPAPVDRRRSRTPPRRTGQGKNGGQGGNHGNGGGKNDGGGSAVRTASTYQGKQICKRYNDNRGCKDKKCPNRHVCDVIRPSGQPCGSTKHKRDQHRD